MSKILFSLFVSLIWPVSISADLIRETKNDYRVEKNYVKHKSFKALRSINIFKKYKKKTKPDKALLIIGLFFSILLLALFLIIGISGITLMIAYGLNDLGSIGLIFILGGLGMTILFVFIIIYIIQRLSGKELKDTIIKRLGFKFI
jgi:hypothetical protein